MNTVETKSIALQKINEREVLRYCRSGLDDLQTQRIITECAPLVDEVVSAKVCFARFDITVSSKTVNFGEFSLQSEQLARLLEKCKSAVVFCATVGLGIDRLIKKHALSPAKALVVQAMGTERIEAACNEFCRWYKNQSKCAVTARFSPGYGDLNIECQQKIFEVLDCNKRIGVTLNDSMMMVPTKSVTAIFGLGECD